MTQTSSNVSSGHVKGLLSRRHDVAIYPNDALVRDEPPDDHYLYRPGEVLLPQSQVGLFLAAAKAIGARAWQVGADGRAVDASVGLDEGVPPSAVMPPDEDGQLARFVVPATVELHTLLDRLTRSVEGLRATPNHVLFMAPGSWVLRPADEPRVPEHVPPELLAPSPDEGTWDVHVAVLDGGLPQDFEANSLLHTGVETSGQESWGYQGHYPVMTFPQGHGSFVAGVVRRHTSEVRISAYLTADADGVVDEWTLAQQVDQALADHRRPIINLSLGGPSRRDLQMLGMKRLAAAAARPDGPIVVAAAGNLGTSRKFWPAAEPWAIGVGAVDLRGPAPHRAWFSNWGDWVDVCADGVNVLSSFEQRPYRPLDDPTELRYFEGFALWSGTSFSAPRVSAALARLLHAHPEWTRQDLLDELAATGPRIPGLGTFVA